MKIILITLFAALFIIGPYSWSVALAERIKIGVAVPLTGTTANWGKDVLNAVKFANDELAGGRYQLIVEDDKCDPKEAVLIAHKFVGTDRLQYTIGQACSGPLLAAAPVYEKAKVVAIAACASAAKISEAGDYIFRTWPSDDQGVVTLAQYIMKHHRRLGILTEQTEYAQGILDGVKKNKRALEIFSEEYVPGTTDFRSLLLRLKQQNIDAILLNPQGDSTLIPMLTQLKQMAFSVPKYAMYYGSSETVRNLTGDLTNDLLFADAPESDAIATSMGKDLIAKFKSRYEINFSPMVIMSAIEGFRALDAAISSGKDVREFLYSTQFHGTFGDWSFDSNGDIRGIPFVMKRIVDKKIVLVSE